MFVYQRVTSRSHHGETAVPEDCVYEVKWEEFPLQEKDGRRKREFGVLMGVPNNGRFIREYRNILVKWMMTRGTSVLGKQHIPWKLQLDDQGDPSRNIYVSSRTEALESLLKPKTKRI